MMNDSSGHDDILPTDVEALLEHGKPLSHKVINTLAQTVPQADNAFQQDLERVLMAQLTRTINQKEKHKMYAHTTQLPHIPKHMGQLLTGIFSLMVIVLAGIFIFNINYNALPLMSSATATTETPITAPIVIAVQDISAGTIITEDMVQIIHLPVNELDTLRIENPEREFFPDTVAVIGQMVAVDIFWFQPIMTISLGEVAGVCDITAPNCPPLPNGYNRINLPADEKMVSGLAEADSVDVLAVIDGELHMIAENILLMDIQSNEITLGAPSWKHSILAWLYRSNEEYALRLHRPVDSEAEADVTLTPYSFTVGTPLPEDYRFELIVTFPLAQGYLLIDAPASLEQLGFVENHTMLEFWFEQLEVIEITPLSPEEGTRITLEMTADDVANLEYLLTLGAEIGFIPLR